MFNGKQYQNMNWIYAKVCKVNFSDDIGIIYKSNPCFKCVKFDLTYKT